MQNAETSTLVHATTSTTTTTSTGVGQVGENGTRAPAGRTGLQHPNWCFTFNYVAGQEPGVLQFWENVCEKAHFAIAGYEVAPTTGQLHLQGYVQFESKQRLSALKRFRYGVGVHWEPARGDEEANIAYCSKTRETGGEILQHGDEPRVINGGKRVKREWATTLDLCKQGKFEEIDPQVQITQCRNLEYIHKKYMKRPADLDHTTKMKWIYGPTGTGKSRMARQIMEGHTWYDKTQNKWWDHYNGEEYVLIDDLEKEYAIKLVAHLKRWLDIYPFVGEMKGSVQKYIRPKNIIITSNFHPEQIFDIPEWLDPIMRRCQVIYKGPPILQPIPTAAGFNTPPPTATPRLCPAAPKDTGTIEIVEIPDDSDDEIEIINAQRYDDEEDSECVCV